MFKTALDRPENSGPNATWGWEQKQGAWGMAGQRLDLGAVVSDTFAVTQRNLKTFALAGVVLIGAPSLLSAAVRLISRVPTIPTLARGAAPSFPQFTLPVLLIGLVALVLGLVLQAGLFYAAAKDLEDGEQPQFGDLISVGLKRCLPLLGLYILVALAVWIGGLLLIVPGIIVALRWCVAGPVLAVEGKGVFASMKRSAILTKGRRWTLFLLGLIVFAVLLVIELGLLALVGGLAGAAAIASFATGASPTTLILIAIVSPIISIVFGILAGVFGGTLFQHLRSDKESYTSKAVAEVFA